MTRRPCLTSDSQTTSKGKEEGPHHDWIHPMTYLIAVGIYIAVAVATAAASYLFFGSYHYRERQERKRK